MAGRIAEATGIKPTLEKPHPGRVLLRHLAGPWEMILAWSRKPGAGWRTTWTATLTYNGQPHSPFGSLTTYAAAVRGAPCTPPVVVPARNDEEIPALAADRLAREVEAAAGDESWSLWAGRLGSRWVVVGANSEGGHVIHWNFICQSGTWVYDPIDGCVAWDELGEVTRELAAVLRAQKAETATGSPRTMAGVWSDVRAMRTAQAVGSVVETRLRV
ncbi:hypothetical protein [Streptomyces sp. NPDC046685]|uniref:hypothetical protein n=1 Tax=Streptomyces sp. NPDC046685 TaxID=3157202 RepID=UPI0033FA8FF0